MLVTWLLWPCAGKLKSFNSQHSHWWQYPLMYSSMVRILWMNEWVWWSTLTPLPSLIANDIHPHTFFLLLWTATVCWGWQMWVGLVLWMASSIQYPIFLSNTAVVIPFCLTLLVFWGHCVPHHSYGCGMHVSCLICCSQIVVDLNGRVVCQWSLC